MSLIIGLLLTAAVLFFFEVFLPGGILGMIGGAFVLLATLLTYMDYGFFPAFTVFVGGLLVGLLLLMFELKLLSNSPLTRHIRHNSSIDARVNSTDSETLIGKKGVALTTLSPQGKVRIDEETFTAFAIEGYLSKGTAITILRTEPFKLIVKKS